MRKGVQRVNENRVVLDTDFISGITEYDAGDAADLFRRTFSTLGKKPVVHSFVADRELVHNQTAQILLHEGFVQSISCKELSVPAGMDGEAEYRASFDAMYMRIKSEKLPEHIDIFGRNAGKSFGEIHSILLATELGIPLLYSNDSDAKMAASFFPKGRLTIMNAEDVAELLKNQDFVTGKERRFIRNYYRRKQR